MNKFLGCAILCLLVTPAWSMEKLWLKEFGDRPAKASELRKTLSPENQSELDFELSEILCDQEKRKAPDACDRLQRLLDRGASVEICDGNTWCAACSDSEKFFKLLLAYGGPHSLVELGSIGILRKFLQAGIDINLEPNDLYYGLFPDYHLDVVEWKLSHHVNPNLFYGDTRPPLHGYIRCHNLSRFIAILQHGARLDIVFDGKTSLEYARMISEIQCEGKKIRNAQYSLLWAISENHLDPNNLTQAECKAHGISDESTRLIVEAAQKVNEARAEARLADIKYEHDNLTKYVLDRAIGHSGTRKR